MPTAARRSTPRASSSTARTLDGPASLRQALLDRREAFVATATEKLLTYALGRRVEYFDMPAVRAIVRDAARRRLPVLVARGRDRARACRSR